MFVKMLAQEICSNDVVDRIWLWLLTVVLPQNTTGDRKRQVCCRGSCKGGVWEGGKYYKFPVGREELQVYKG